MKRTLNVFLAPLLIVLVLVCFTSVNKVQAQAAGLTIINTQPCAVLIGGGAVGPLCAPCPGGTTGPIIVAGGGFGVVPPACPATYRWRYVKFQTLGAATGGGSDSPFNLCPPVFGAPMFANCGFGTPPFTGVWLTANLVIL